ncbi:MAG: NB-ARC domain-containing protein [Aggregatilineales bacterium]
MTPITDLPSSETQGLVNLDKQGNCFGNLPSAPKNYISRSALEKELYEALTNDRHPVITLVGRGGIGKTWLALWVLHQVSQSNRFDAILWFSARDIDLLPEGPKYVQPDVLTEDEIAKMFVKLLGPAQAKEKGFNRIQYLSDSLTTSGVGRLLFVFDNFETVRSPAGIYSWLDSHIRTPNKILITTRHRDFKADYPVEVRGMTEPEFEELVDTTASSLGIRLLLTEDYLRELYGESDGHPYVVKVLLGEVAKAGKIIPVERITANKERILEALFERTYSGLSPVAQRIFMTLSNWRSIIPQLALEAVLLRPANERMDVVEGIEELRKSSFLEVTPSTEDQQLFLVVPFVAALFGQQKLRLSPLKSAIEADLSFLRAFGATQQSDIRHGISPRINRMFREVAFRITQKGDELATYLPMLEFVAREYPPAWLTLASLYQESGFPNGLEEAKSSIRHFLEHSADNDFQQGAWQQLAELCRITGDYAGEVHALVEICKLPSVDFGTISSTANRVNVLLNPAKALSQEQVVWEYGEKRIIIQNLVELMESRIDEADATDYSRLGWLCLHLNDPNRTRYYAGKGLEIDPYNSYCAKIMLKLNG